MIKLTKFARKELKNIEKRFNELFGDNDCSGNYICNHETIDKHWVVYEDDLQALKSYIAMTVYDIDRNANLEELKKELIEHHDKYPDMDFGETMGYIVGFQHRPKGLDDEQA